MQANDDQQQKRDHLSHSRRIRQHSSNSYNKKDCPYRAHAWLRMPRKCPDNETGTQWPHQVQKSTGVAMIKIGGEKCRNPEFWWRWRLPKDHLRSGSFLEQA